MAGIYSVLILCSFELSFALFKENRIIQTLQGELPGKLRENAKYALNELDSTPICGVDIPVVANATWAYASRDGSSVVFTCDVGFVTNGGSTSFDYSCVSGSTITTSQLSDSCNIIKCPRPARMENAEMTWPGGVHATTGDYGSTVDYMCDVGFSGDGKANGPRIVKMACDATGVYTYVLNTITSCDRVHCTVPLSMRNAVVSSTTDKTVLARYNETVSYDCAEGYVSSGDATTNNFTLTCGDDGEFMPNDPLPRCVELACGDPPLLEHATTIQISGKVPIDSRVIYRCDTGYFVTEIPASSTFNVRCELLNGFPQYAIPTVENRCKANTCLPMPSLENAVVDSLNTVWRYKDRVPFACIPGYTLGGVKGQSKFDGACNSQGMWTINDHPECAKVVCGTSADIPADMLVYGYLHPFTESTTVSYGMSTTVVCTDGALVVGSGGGEATFEIVCGPDGDYIISGGGVCAIPCPIVPKVSHSTSRDFGKILEFGNAPATISCKPGYQTAAKETDQQILCNRDGTLSHISECTPIPNYIGYGSGNTDEEPPDIWGYQDAGALSDGAFLRKTSDLTIQGVLVALSIVLIVAL